MIKLIVDGYCKDCPEFEANVTKLDMGSYGSIKTETIISCEHSDRCSLIFKHIRNSLDNPLTKKE